MKKIFFFCVLLFLAYFSCQKLITYKGFVLTQIPYTGSELRIDGYYYKYYECYKGSNCIDMRCFYRNGIILDMGGVALSLEEADEYIQSKFIEGSTHPNYEYSKWGLFIIDGQIIKIEQYYATDDITRWTYIREGVILNDTTFLITVFYRSDGKERVEVDEIYHFRHFYPKPDSTNNFIK
jgi:hypothetical protein